MGKSHTGKVKDRCSDTCKTREVYTRVPLVKSSKMKLHIRPRTAKASMVTKEGLDRIGTPPVTAVSPSE